MKRRKIQFRKRRLPTPPKCLLCQENLELDYKKPEILIRFISDRGKILARNRSGVCAKHQRKLAREIKRARFLSLLPFVVKVR